MRDLILNFFKKYKYHFLIWTIFFAYEIVYVGILTGKFSSPEIYAFHYVFYVSLFYFHADVLLKYTLDSPNKFLKFSIAFLVIIEIMFFICIKYICEILFYKYVDHNSLKGYEFNLPKIIMLAYRPIYFICNSTAYYCLIHARQQQHLLEEMEQQDLENIIQEKEIKNELILTQNAFLRSQINPDFLINTLGYLYNETYETAPKAAESILSLSDIMRYALSEEAATGHVKLEKEINLIERFLLLHQARQVHKAHLTFSYSQESLSIAFIPLVLMTLVENILKHGQLDDPLKPAEIKINYENSILSIETSNLESGNNEVPSHGIGLKNIKDRLHLTYGEKATFDYYLDSNHYFHTTIKVRI